MKDKIILLTLGLFFVLDANLYSKTILISPSRNIEVELYKDKTELSFIVYLDKWKIGIIKFGILGEGIDLLLSNADNLICEDVSANDSCNEYILRKSTSNCFVRFRIYNDAIAFRYECISNSDIRVLSEKTSFMLEKNTRIWHFERKNPWKMKSYAGTWENCMSDELYNKSYSRIEGMPLIFKTHDGKYGFITEAVLYGYSGMRLKINEDDSMVADFTEGSKGFNVGKRLKTPWRILSLFNNLNEMVNQTVVKRLSPLPDKELFIDKSYIIPGKSVWRWYSKGTGTPKQERDMVKMASNLKFNYSIIDEGWRLWKNYWDKIKSLSHFARKKNVRLFLWQHSAPLAIHDGDYQYMRNFLDSVNYAGIAGIKVDFMDSESKYYIDFETRLLKECAKRNLLVNFHGCQKPSGECYTYPNEITREGIRGMEVNKMKEGWLPAYHNAALPFTRFVVGHADYTPLCFTTPGETSFAHQLATLICFDSPLQVIAEDPTLLLKDKHLLQALDYIKNVPTTWDEIKVLEPSEIQKLAVIAKRKGEKWYIGILNGENFEKNICIDLSEIIKADVKAEAFVDDIDTNKIIISVKHHRLPAISAIPSVPFKKISINKKNNIIHLAPQGGAVIIILLLSAKHKKSV